jgi:hypothetical protein
MKELIVKNSYNKIDGGKLVIPENIKQIKFDIGLAGEAPNSAIWLSETSDRFVIGVEPIPYHWDMIQNFETSNSLRPYPNNFSILQLEEGVVKLAKNNLCKIGDRFLGLEAAIDDVKGIQKRTFYQTTREGGASGASSLLKHNSSHPQGNQIESVYEVNTISLSSIFDYIPWDRFEYIEHVKTDCEGYDYHVVKSIGDYLKKVVYISSEMLRRELWDGKPSDSEFINFMVENDFSILNEGNGEINFVNNKLKNKIIEDKLNNKTLGL